VCGICGFTGNQDTLAIKRMCGILSHRGPDDEGYYVDSNISLGIRRLSIIDIQGGHQPIHNEDETIWVVLNGEIYNFQELREFLDRKGHSFYTKTDTEVIVHLYEEYGDACMHTMRGMFAFALWYKNKKKLLIVRDRLGIKPLYYTYINGRLIFASEIKSILECPDVKREVNFNALDLYLTLQYVPAPLTMFKGIYKLPPGHFLSYYNGNTTTRRYWDVVFSEADRYADEESASCEFRRLLKEAVRLEVVSEVPIGALLSGGIDSAAVVGLMNSITSEPAQTFTVGFDVAGGKYNELHLARITSNHFRTSHHEVIVKASATEILPKLIYYMDEPIADQAALPTYLICKFAKEFVTVALTGEGGDELLGGYPRYAYFKMAIALQNILPAFIREKMLLNIIKILPFNHHLKRRLNDLLLNKDIIKRHIDWIANFTEDEKTELYKSKMKENILKDNLLLSQIFDNYFNIAGQSDIIHSLMYMDIKTWLVDDLLTKVDRMSMAVSLEARVPLLDYKLVEFISRLPSNFKVNWKNTKALFRSSMKGFLPEAILKGKKHAFLVPVKEWFRGEMNKYAKSILLSEQAVKRGFFNDKYIQWMIEEHNTGKRDFSQKLWNLLCLEIWHRVFIDKNLNNQ